MKIALVTWLVLNIAELFTRLFALAKCTYPRKMTFTVDYDVRKIILCCVLIVWLSILLE